MEQRLTEYNFTMLPEWVEIRGQFDNTCVLYLSTQSENAVQKGQLKLKIIQHGNISTISNAHVSLESISGIITIYIGADNPRIIFGANTSGTYDLRLWREASVKIGKNTTSNGVRIICDMSEIKIGADCMFSDHILIQSADQHGIVDIASGVIVNNKKRKIYISDHVWLGRQCTLMPDISIGRGSIIGTGAIVTNNISDTSVAVGVPARVVRTNTTWCRSPISLDDMSRKIISEYAEQAEITDRQI